jgi:catechol 2,3-dioxygenase-like lactoylglutathione lyase family enzyme
LGPCTISGRMKLPGLDHLTLPVAEMKRSLEFYTRAFGLQLLWEEGDLAVLRGEGRLDLALKLSPADTRMPNAFHFGFKVDSVDELAKWEHHLRACGANIQQVDKNGEVGSLYLLDPDGHCLEIYCPPAESR